MNASIWNPAFIDTRLESRAITFENPSGERGSGGIAANGRKGAPMRVVAPGERVVLADITGPGTVRHVWMTFPPAPPEVMRAKLIEVFYDGADEPSVSVPAVDFFGVPWGRPVHLDTALTSINEGRGFNSFIPMPFRGSLRMEFVNAAERPTRLYYQVDYTLEPELDRELGYLHATYRRENPTTLREDFVICDGLSGPGRFLGAVVGVRVLDDGVWYGEGEVKMYLDGDGERPTICGTGLEDYVGSAWGMGAHQAQFLGAPLDVRDPDRPGGQPDFVGFYRWHLPDPIVFRESLRVTIQQIGFDVFTDADAQRMAARSPAGDGWQRIDAGGIAALGICERSDDYCAVAYVMCTRPQAVPRVALDDVVTAIERRPYEQPSATERMFTLFPSS